MCETNRQRIVFFIESIGTYSEMRVEALVNPEAINVTGVPSLACSPSPLQPPGLRRAMGFR